MGDEKTKKSLVINLYRLYSPSMTNYHQLGTEHPSCYKMPLFISNICRWTDRHSQESAITS